MRRRPPMRNGQPILSAKKYRAALAALDLTHATIESRTGINQRTSYRYAETGAPRWIGMLLELMLREREREEAPRE